MNELGYKEQEGGRCWSGGERKEEAVMYRWGQREVVCSLDFSECFPLPALSDCLIVCL